MTSPERPLRPPETLALELVNTARLADGAPIDRLRSPTELIAWLEQAALAPPGPILDALRSPATSRILLDEARRLRLDLERLFEAFSTRKDLPAPALYGLNRVLSASCTSRRLEASGTASRIEEHEIGGDVLAVLAPVALSAARVLVDVDPLRLRRCASPACGIWFVDTSKAGRRRWCSMARCGNQAKAARHRRRGRTD